MASKRIRPSRRMLFIWCILAASILLFLPQHWTNRFQFAFAHLFRWPMSLGRNVSLSARMPRPADGSHQTTELQYQNYIAHLEEALKQAHEKIDKISGLRDRLPLQGAKLMLADVIRLAIEPLRCELMINRGSENGLAKGQFVLANDSIIGTISEVAPKTAVVKLFTDPASTITVNIRGFAPSRLLLQGDGNRRAKIKMLRQKVKLATQVMASKKPGFLEAPMVVGTVAACERNAEPLLWDISVQPVCNIEAVSDVVVIVMNPKD